MVSRIFVNRDGYESDYTLSAQNRLRLTAKVAISISVLSALVLLVLFYFLLLDEAGENYFHTVLTLTHSQDQLTIYMLIGGSLVVLIAALITWIITLYSSHRVAGPLFRFTKNLEMVIEEGPVATIGLRKEDSFQELSHKLSRATAGLNQNYDKQRQVVDEFVVSLDSAQGISAKQFSELLKKLKNTVNIES